MKRYFQSSISAVALSAMVMSGVVATVSITASPAFSKSNNANSNSNGGNRNDNSNRGGRDNSNRNDNSNGRGAVASSLGALNAAHANANALANASENSRVGMIALYKSAVIASAEAAVQIEEAQADYDEYVAAQEAAGFESTYGTYDDYLTADPTPSEEEILHWETLNSLQTAIDTATTEAETAKALENEALELAANKETSEEVIAALWDLLDI